MYRGRPPPEPESESEWDSESEMASVSHSVRMDAAPKIEMSSADEFPAKNTRNKTTNQKAVKTKSMTDERSQRLQDDEISSKASTPKSGRSRKSNQKKPDPLSTFTFSDRSVQNGVDTSLRQVSRKQEAPPYDFKSALTDQANNGTQKTPKPPGKNRKGSKYDAPVTPQDSADEAEELELDQTNKKKSSWDETEAGDRTVHQLMQNNKPTPPLTQRSEVKVDPEEDGLQQSGHSWRNQHGLGSKFGQRKKAKESPRQQPAISMSAQHLIDESDESGQKHKKEAKAVKVFKERNSSESQDSDSLHNSRYVYMYEDGRRDYSTAHQDRTHASMTRIADKAETYLTRFWQEVFAVLRIVMLAVVTLIIQLVKFVTRDIFQSLVVGLLIVIGDHVIKPLLSALFNGFIQPAMVLLWNILHALKNAFQPLFLILNGIFHQIAVMLRSFRLVEINWRNNNGQPYPAIEEV